MTKCWWRILLLTALSLTTGTGAFSAADGAGAHGAKHSAAPPELPHIFHVINSIQIGDNRTIGDTAFGHFTHDYHKHIFMVFVTVLMCWLFTKTVKMSSGMPGKFQAFIELIVENLMHFFTGILGKENLKHVPFICTLFLFIWVNNLIGIIPGFSPATSKPTTTMPLAIMSFIYVTFYGIYQGGGGHFLWHMAGSPASTAQWIVSPLIFVLELFGLIIKPLSLGLRLFGNIFGEDIAMGVFLLLGIMMGSLAMADPIIGVPLHLPFLFLGLLTSTIQALVFSLLSAIYLAMLLPHHDHAEDGHAEHHHHDDPIMEATHMERSEAQPAAPSF